MSKKMLRNNLAQRDFKDLSLTFTNDQLADVNEMMEGFRLVKIMMKRPLSGSDLSHLKESKQEVVRALEKFGDIKKDYIETTLYSEFIVFKYCEIIRDDDKDAEYYLVYFYDKKNSMDFEMIFRKFDTLLFQNFEELTSPTRTIFD